jgi:hypothetical protein
VGSFSRYSSKKETKKKLFWTLNMIKKVLQNDCDDKRQMILDLKLKA